MVKVESASGEFGSGITNHRKCQSGDNCTGPGCKVRSKRVSGSQRTTDNAAIRVAMAKMAGI